MISSPTVCSIGAVAVVHPASALKFPSSIAQVSLRGSVFSDAYMWIGGMSAERNCPRRNFEIDSKNALKKDPKNDPKRV